jgi:hypothetical protein
MAQEPQEQASPQPDSPIWAARKLLRAARVGALGTVADGQPFASMVTPATFGDLSVLLLLSSLADHTRNLQAEPRCSLLVVGTPTDANPQTAPRLSLSGLAAPDPDPALKARWLAVHPYAVPYADFGDLAIWRFRPVQTHYVGGFARAERPRPGELLPDPAAVAAIAAAADDIMAHCNRDHPDALAVIARHAGGAGEGPWQMAGVDVDGCDLACGEQVLRIAWSAPVADAGSVAAELARLARAARAA